MAVALGLTSGESAGSRVDTLGTAAEDVDPTAVLVDAGVLVPEADGHALDGTFRARWLDSMGPLRDATDEELADGVRGVRPEASVGVETSDGRSSLVLSGGLGGRDTRLSRAAAMADVAAVHTLVGADVDRGNRLVCVPVLRQYLERCPECEVELVTDSVGGTDVGEGPAVTTCPDCGSRLYVAD